MNYIVTENDGKEYGPFWSHESAIDFILEIFSPKNKMIIREVNNMEDVNNRFQRNMIKITHKIR